MTLTVTRNEAGDFEYRNEAGQLHHDHGPAIVKSTGEQYFYQNGVLNEMATNMFNNYLANSFDDNNNCTNVMKVVSDENGIRYYCCKLEIEDLDYFKYVLHNDFGPAEISHTGAQYWRCEHAIVRRNDLPAIVSGDGTMVKYVSDHECYHRLDGPAIKCTDGRYAYYIEGQLHRLDGPARKLKDGTLQYWKEGQLHNDNGPAIVKSDGSVEYWINGYQIESLTSNVVLRKMDDVSDDEIKIWEFGALEDRNDYDQYEGIND